MSSFIANSQMYNINTENEVAAMLSHFNSDYIISITNYNLNSRLIDNVLPMPNIITSFEQSFKDIKTRYNTDLDKIESVRLQTYKEIIDNICRKYNIDFIYNDSLDMYSAAYYIYDFFVCNFYKYVIDFLSMYIYKERNGIYESMHLNDLKKNKDSSTIYGKKMYKDVKIAVINANIEYVLQNMKTYDIGIGNILYTIYNKNIATYLLSIIRFNSDFYKEHYISIIDTEWRPSLITNLRLAIQKNCVEINDQILSQA